MQNVRSQTADKFDYLRSLMVWELQQSDTESVTLHSLQFVTSLHILFALFLVRSTVTVVVLPLVLNRESVGRDEDVQLEQRATTVVSAVLVTVVFQIVSVAVAVAVVVDDIARIKI